MSTHGWRNLSVVLGGACIVLLWRDCHAMPSPCAASDTATVSRPPRPEHAAVETVGGNPGAPAEPAAPATPADEGASITAYGFTIPAWAAWLAPLPGEDLRAYRNRMLPLALAVVAPHRARVARSRDDFAGVAQLDTQQRATLDAATRDTAAAIQDRVIAAVLNGELAPETFKPMAAVALARDVSDLVGQGNQRFVGSLREDQRAKLAQHPFDFADYLVFSTHWEDALKLLD